MRVNWRLQKFNWPRPKISSFSPEPLITSPFIMNESVEHKKAEESICNTLCTRSKEKIREYLNRLAVGGRFPSTGTRQISG